MRPKAKLADRVRGEELRTVLKRAIARLEGSTIPSAPLAAELLLMQVIQHERAWLYAHPEHELALDEIETYSRLVESRATGVPTQYLTGRQEFWGLEFEVGPGVLIPRPETEHVIEVALARLGPRRQGSLRIADVGTGSGCIAIALACELPHAEIIAIDISAAALDYSRRNAMRHGVSNQIRFVRGDLLEAGLQPADHKRAAFDLIVSNPPYVGLKDAPGLPREVRDHEPPEALFAGDDGLGLYPRLVEDAARMLGPNGTLVLEIGYNGASFVRSLLAGPPWSHVETSNDLAGIERVISAVYSLEAT